ncbi:MAG: aminotransferase class V-fold PLP-dependent enzyme, partial [Selenomonadaceae bacterium]|nr:aminotransferase class V-fold PLP-dependent enzyme [Selenomonadaceae bacterium]
ALKGKAFSFYPKPIHVITSSIEHHAVLHSCDFLKKMGHEVSYLSADSHGAVSCSEMQKFFLPHTKLVSVMLANNETGTMEPVKDLARIAHEHGVVFHTDAVQAWGHTFHEFCS